jgi:sigma-E factor negative regulatory protein RseC
MIEQTAVVSRVENGQVWLSSRQLNACSGCAQQTGCTSATLAKGLPKREFQIDSPIALKAGDQVLITVDDAPLMFSTFLLYGLPLLTMLIGSISASILLPASIADKWLPLGAFMLLLLVFRCIYPFQAAILRLCQVKPQLVAVQQIIES